MRRKTVKKSKNGIKKRSKATKKDDIFGDSWYLGVYSGIYHFNSFDKDGVRLTSLKASTAKDLIDLLTYEISSKYLNHRQKQKKVRRRV